MKLKFFVSDYSAKKDLVKKCWSDLSWQGGSKKSGTWSDADTSVTGYWQVNPTEIVYEGPRGTDTLKSLKELAEERGYEYESAATTVDDLGIVNPFGHLGEPPAKIRSETVDFVKEYNEERVDDPAGVSERVEELDEGGKLW